MAEVSLPFGREHAEPVRETAVERFLTWPRTAALAAFALFALSLGLVKVQDDGAVYFDFMRRVFGVPTDGVAYQFGSDFWNAPFWLVSQLVAVRGGLDHFQAGQVAVSVASFTANVVTLYVGWRLLRDLDLPRGAAVLLLTLFGTPLWYYGTLEPSYKHAADTLYSTAAFWFLLRAARGRSGRRAVVAAGCCCALLLTTRYANVGLVAGALVGLWAARLRRPAGMIALATIGFALVFFALPLIRHIPYADPPPNTYGLGADTPALPPATSAHLALGLVGLHVYLPTTNFDPLAPVKMLFTLHRGIFIWTPLTGFATIGFLLLLRRDRANRAFLVSLGCGALGLLAVHSFWGGAWDGFGSFSNRFLTALFPLFLIGTSEFVRVTRRRGTALLTVCACFSFWLGLLLFNGYYDQSRFDSLVQPVEAYAHVTGPATTRFHQPPPPNSLQNLGRQLGDRVIHRWELYWRLVT